MASAEFCPTLLSPSKPATAVVHPVQVDRDSATSRELPNLEARPERPIDLPQRPLAAALPWLVPSLESSTIIAFAHKYPVSHPARTDIRTGEFSFADTIAWVVEDVERQQLCNLLASNFAVKVARSLLAMRPDEDAFEYLDRPIIELPLVSNDIKGPPLGGPTSMMEALTKLLRCGSAAQFQQLADFEEPPNNLHTLPVSFPTVVDPPPSIAASDDNTMQLFFDDLSSLLLELSSSPINDKSDASESADDDWTWDFGEDDDSVDEEDVRVPLDQWYINNTQGPIHTIQGTGYSVKSLRCLASEWDDVAMALRRCHALKWENLAGLVDWAYSQSAFYSGAADMFARFDAHGIGAPKYAIERLERNGKPWSPSERFRGPCRR